jgi:tRNA1(Val) A37 N6-methylase TrmN6
MSQVATTDNRLLEGNLTIRQPEKGFRVTSDTLLLAASIAPKPDETVLDLGCGVGGAFLAASYRLPQVRFIGIEKESTYFDLARFNIEANNLTSRVTLHHGDVSDTKLVHTIGQVDHVIVNPPYYPHQTHCAAPDRLKNVARQTSELTIGDWVQAANRFLKPKGTVTFIYPASDMSALMHYLSAFAGNMTVLPLWPRANVEAKRVIIQATKNSAAPLRLLPGLVLHEDNINDFTPAARDYINGVKGLDLA